MFEKISNRSFCWKCIIALLVLYYLLTVSVDYVTFHFLGFNEISSSGILEQFDMKDLEFEDLEWTFKQYGILHFVFPFIFLLLKTVCITVCLYVGNVIMKFCKLSFVQFGAIVVIAQAIPICYTVVDCAIQYITGSTNIFDLRYDLSIAKLFDGHISDTINMIISPVLSAINSIELIFWIALSMIISKITKIVFGKSFKYVASTYGVGFVIYLVALTLITISI